MAATTAVAVGDFAGTSPKGGRFWAGQCTGIAVLIAASAIAAVGLSVVPDRWVG